LIISREGEDVTHLQIHPLFAGADVTNTFEHFIEVIRHAWTGRILKARVIQDEALD